MSDPKNVAHDKKVQQEKKHNGEVPASGATEKPKPGKKPTLKKADSEGESFQQHAHQTEAEEKKPDSTAQ
ncbi:hypothetical protein [Zavarzinella formosa]|uniref:hypothetical protein n=1 Tax=Zavarzinella formosa TaxID=360055 RepID=UPI00031FA00F|nr:hypothetical protein [Zavarzinella formosa]